MNPFRPRISFLFTIVAATVFYFVIGFTTWKEALAIFVIWICGFMAGLLDAELVNDDK